MAPVLVGTALFISACPAMPPASATDNLCAELSDSSEVIGQQGDLSATQAELDAELMAIPERARARYEQDKERAELVNRILLNKALFSKVEAEGLLDDPVVRHAARMAAQKAYVNALFKSLEEKAVADAAVMAHYEENQARFARPMARVRHILVKDEGLATDILGKINAGDDFAALAQLHSEDKGSKTRGGELPWATKDRWVKEFGEAAFGLQANEVSDLVQSKYGFHIIQLLEKRDKQPLEEVRPGIERLLSRNAVRDYREKVRTEAGLPSPGAAKGARRPNPHQRGNVKLPQGAAKGNRVPPTAGKPTQAKPVGASGK
jgi:peptidylprolyl isomerase/foldase protein PrsA